jgi:hypothetical protein
LPPPGAGRTAAVPSEWPRSAAALVFDLNYTEHTTDGEAGALCRQLNYSFAANRRAARPFPLLVVGGESVPPTTDTAAAGGGAAAAAPPLPLRPGAPRLIQLLHKSNWWCAAGVHRSDSTTPWDAVATAAGAATAAAAAAAASAAHAAAAGGAQAQQRLLYLTADSPHELFCDASTEAGAREAAALAESTAFVIGGLVDRIVKPGMSYARAQAAGLRTARLPLDRFLRLHNRCQEGDAGGADITTLAVVQILLLFRETRDWGLAVSRCPALRCAPLRKYVRWLPPYEHLNGAERPHDFRGVAVGDGDGDASEAEDGGSGGGAAASASGE